MKHKWIGGLAVMLLVFAGFSQAMGSSVTKTEYYQAATRTIKFAMETDSLQALGHYHYSSGALKTPWVAVPVGIDFIAFIQCPDADSLNSASVAVLGPDTVGIALETSPYHGLAHDSASAQYKKGKAKIIWDHRTLTFQSISTGVQKLFNQTYFDSTIDTIDVEATSLKTGLKKTPPPTLNMGMLRFSLCVDAQDSVLDGVLRMHCYIIYHENDNPSKSYGALTPEAVEYAVSLTKADAPVWARHVEVPENAIYLGTFRNEVK